MKKLMTTILALAIATVSFAAPAKKSAAPRTIAIKISGGDYIPNVINVKKGEKVRLVFTRDSKPTCGDVVVIPALNIKKAIPVNKPTAIDIQANKAGTLKMTCGMDMFDGKIVVTE